VTERPTTAPATDRADCRAALLVAASKNDVETIILNRTSPLRICVLINNPSVDHTFSLGVVKLLQTTFCRCQGYASVFSMAQSSGNFMFMLAALSSLCCSDY
jgi:hypothetical protein